MRLIYNCVEKQSFITNFANQLVSSINEEHFTNYIKGQISKGQKEYLIKNHWLQAENDALTVALLDSTNTTALANRMGDLTDHCIEAWRPNLLQLQDILGLEWEAFTPIIIIHLVMGNLWQSIWSKLVASQKGGCIVLVCEPELCQALFSDIITLKSDNIAIYPLTGLQKNNTALQACFTDKNTIKMLRSIDELGFVLPLGQATLQLLELKLIAAKKVKGDFVSNYQVVAPQIDIDIVHKLRSFLTESTKLSYQFLQGLHAILTACYQVPELSMGSIDLDDYLLAGIYVWNHVVAEKLINLGFMPELSDIPSLSGLGARILFTHGIT